MVLFASNTVWTMPDLLRGELRLGAYIWLQVEDVRVTRIDRVLDEISAYLLFDNNNLERMTLEEFAMHMADFTRQCATNVAGKSYRVEESLSELVAMLYRRASSMLKECVEVTGDANGLFIVCNYFAGG